MKFCWSSIFSRRTRTTTIPSGPAKLERGPCARGWSPEPQGHPDRAVAGAGHSTARRGTRQYSPKQHLDDYARRLIARSAGLCPRTETCGNFGNPPESPTRGRPQAVIRTGSQTTKVRSGFPVNSRTWSVAEAPCKQTVQVGERSRRSRVSSFAALNAFLITATFCGVSFSSGARRKELGHRCRHKSRSARGYDQGCNQNVLADHLI